MLNNKIFAIIGIVFLALTGLVTYSYIQVRQQRDVGAADILPQQCLALGGIVYPSQSCPPGYTQKGTVDDGSQTGDLGDIQKIGQGVCCVPDVIPLTLTPSPTITGAPSSSPTPTPVISTTITPTPTPMCPLCEPVKILPISGTDTLPSCDPTCDFTIIQDPNSCPALNETVSIRLDEDGCITYDVDGTKITKCGKKGDVLTFPASRSGHIIISLTCNRPTAQQQQMSFPTGTGDGIKIPSTLITPPIDLVCRKELTVVCFTPTPTITPPLTITVSPTPGFCKLPVPTLLFQCAYGCVRINVPQ